MVDKITVYIINECKGFKNPVLMLKKAQEHIFLGGNWTYRISSKNSRPSINRLPRIIAALIAGNI